MPVLDNPFSEEIFPNVQFKFSLMKKKLPVMGGVLLELKSYFIASLLWNLCNLSQQMELGKFYLLVFKNSLGGSLE